MLSRGINSHFYHLLSPQNALTSTPDPFFCLMRELNTFQKIPWNFRKRMFCSEAHCGRFQRQNTKYDTEHLHLSSEVQLIETQVQWNLLTKQIERSRLFSLFFKPVSSSHYRPGPLSMIFLCIVEQKTNNKLNGVIKCHYSKIWLSFQTKIYRLFQDKASILLLQFTTQHR